MRKTLLLLLTISLWCLGSGSNELFARPGYFKADPVLVNVGSQLNNPFFPANSIVGKYLKGIAVAPPTVTNCDGPISKLEDGSCSANVSWNVPSSLDGNLAALYPQLASNPGVQLALPNHTFPIGRDTVIYRFTNPDGFTECRIPITVLDVTKPTISGGSCGTTIAAVTDAGVCYATNVNVVAPTAADVCSTPVSLTYRLTDFNGTVVSGTVANGASLPSTIQYATGNTVVTFIATDASNNQDSCKATVGVTDNQLPTFGVVPPAIVSGNDAGICGATRTILSPAVNDNCSATLSWTIYTDNGIIGTYEPGIDVVELVGATPNISNYLFTVGNHIIVYTATDASNQTATAFTPVSITDTENPQIGCPTINGFTFLTSVNGGYDCSADAALNSSLLSATDNCTPSASLTWNWTLNDSVGNTFLANGTGNFTATLQTGNYYVVYNATDAVGNISQSCTLRVWVRDNELPTWTTALLPDITSYATPGNCFNDTILSSVNATDNCPGITLTWDVKQGTSPIMNGTGLMPSIQFPVGVNTIVWTATDASGNRISDTATFTVIDAIAPTINAGANISINAAIGTCGAAVTRSITFGDNCGVATVVSNSQYGTINITGSNTADFSGTFPVGTENVTFTVTDVNGNVTNSTPLVITVVDAINPTINNFANINQPANANCQFIYSLNIATDFNPQDNCSIVRSVVAIDTDGLGGTYEDTLVSFPGAAGIQQITFAKGITNVRVLAFDPSGNVAFDDFTVTVTDQTAPTVTFQDSIHINIDPSACDSATTIAGTMTLTGANVADNCASDAYLLANGFFTINGGAPIAGVNADGKYAFGTTTVVFTITDDSGNSSTKTVIVDVRDLNAPFDSPNDTINTQNDLTVCSALYKVFAPNSADSCGIASVEYSVNGAPRVTATVVDGVSFPVGTNIVEWFTTDNNNNTRIDTSVIIVRDTEVPTITGPSSVVVNASANCAKDTTISVTVADNCGIDTTSWQLIYFADATDVDGDTTSGSGTSVNFAFPTSASNNVITFYTQDIHGNATTKVITVKVNDNTAPVVNCPGTLSYRADSTICGKSIVVAPAGTQLIDAPITDNCGIQSITAVYGPTNIPFNPTVARTFDVGTTSVTVTITDINGNVKTCTFDIVVSDLSGPVVSNFPASVTVNPLPNECSRIVFWTEPTAVDACNGNNITVTRNYQPGEQFPLGTTTVTYTFTDQIGNQTTRSFNITVADTQTPVITPIANITVYNTSSSCNVNVVYNTNIQDNCETPMITATFPSGSSLAPGTYQNTLTATDKSGNSSSIQFTITVLDTIAPVFTAFPANITTCNPVVNYSSLVNVSDNCGTPNVTISGPASGTAFPVGQTTTVIYTATDAKGNATSRSFTVTVASPTTVANAGADQAICLNGTTVSVTLTGNGLASEQSNWSAAGVGFTPQNAAVTTATFNTPGVYDITYTISGSPVCATTSDVVRVTVSGSPTIANAGLDQAINGTTTTLAANFPVVGSGAWSTTDPNISFVSPNSNSSVVNNLPVGNSALVWTISSGACTPSTDTVIITVNANLVDLRNLHTAFTPNGDGDNETYEIPGIANFPDASVKIYNRYGNIVFESTGATYGKGWDGRFENKELPVASYYYVIDLKDGSAVIKGIVSIIR